MRASNSRIHTPLHRVFTALYRVSLVLACVSTLAAAEVKPVNWAALGSMESGDTLVSRIGTIATNMMNVLVTTWWDKSKAAGKQGQYVNFGSGERDIRAPAGVAKAIATQLRCSLYDADKTGISDSLALLRCITIVKSLAADHKANAKLSDPWGDAWQSASWTRDVALAAWYQWENLDSIDQVYVQRMLEHEANRFNDKTPPASNQNSVSDTKGEENAWNASCLDVAAAMMPNHANVEIWRAKANEYHMTAVATPSDLNNTDLYDGKPVSEWVSGYCFTDEYAAGNHGAYPHPTYILSSFLHGLRSIGYFSLAGQTPPAGSMFNMPEIYRMFCEHKWASPPYQSPGGVLYQPDGTIYWPISKESDRRYRYYLWILYDVLAWATGIDEGSTPAREWIEKHVKIMEDNYDPATGAVSWSGHDPSSFCTKLTETYLFALQRERGMFIVPKADGSTRSMVRSIDHGRSIRNTVGFSTRNAVTLDGRALTNGRRAIVEARPGECIITVNRSHPLAGETPIGPTRR